ncbi:DUF943 family protein [Serratia rhizosphaerae]|uniref:DUF943 family protein n=1 Tax=Serratia sp. Tan611 TaxID=2773264 RepID=UPI0019349B76|nr:DUF943 family protein [Serratia sp. Tan611]MBU3891617.1 DUF943 family protein [Serratia rubidaea]CAE1144302.1 conserved protein of unknown function [Serratia sp. Tan611]
MSIRSMDMRVKLVLLVMAGVLIGYAFWLLLRPLEIVAVHQYDDFSFVLVKNFPLTDKGKIDWWMDNKDMLEQRYGIPQSTSSGFFVITFWDFSDGYKEAGKYDRLCFNDIPTNKKCIDKNKLLTVENNKRKELLFTVDDGRYLMKGSGETIKINRE